MRLRVALIVSVALSACVPPAAAQTPLAVFDLTVTKSDVLKPGKSRIIAESAYLRLAHGLMPGNSDGLEIMFFAAPFTDAARVDVLNNDAKELRKRSYAALVLFLDKQNRVWQVNLSYVVPGTTVAKTVAWKPDDLQKSFSDLQFDGKRMTLKSKGAYSESGQEAMQLSWTVDVNLPVLGEVKR